jgi:hypothetical protein
MMRQAQANTSMSRYLVSSIDFQYFFFADMDGYVMLQVLFLWQLLHLTILQLLSLTSNHYQTEVQKDMKHMLCDYVI